MAKEAKSGAGAGATQGGAERLESSTVLRQNQPPPVCPNCSKKDAQGNVSEPVVCVSRGGNEYFTRYYCPQRCGFSKKIPRPRLTQQLEREATEDKFSAR